jgi:hypothetical protein
MEQLTINKHYTDSTGKVLYLDVTLSLTQGGLTKSANNIFSVNLNEYSEDVAKKIVISKYPQYPMLQTKVHYLFHLANLTETEV